MIQIKQNGYKTTNPRLSDGDSLFCMRNQAYAFEPS